MQRIFFVLCLQSEQELSMQHTLIQSFFGSLNSIDMVRVRGHFPQNPCEPTPWRFVECQDGLITSIDMKSQKFPPLLVDYAPSSVRRFVITHCNQYFPINTRALPRESRFVRFSVNRIFGRIDLQSFPRELQYFYCSENHISGEIVLMNLPRDLRQLDLSYNKIQQRIVYFDAIPESISRISLAKNRIRRIEPFYEYTEYVDPTIFKGMEDRLGYLQCEAHL